MKVVYSAFVQGKYYVITWCNYVESLEFWQMKIFAIATLFIDMPLYLDMHMKLSCLVTHFNLHKIMVMFNSSLLSNNSP